MTIRTDILRGMANIVWLHVRGHGRVPEAASHAATDLARLYEAANAMPVEKMNDLVGSPDAVDFGEHLAWCALTGSALDEYDIALRGVAFKATLVDGVLNWEGDVLPEENPAPKPARMMYEVTWIDAERGEHREILADNQAGNLSRQLRSQGTTHTIRVASELRKTPRVARGSRRS